MRDLFERLASLVDQGRAHVAPQRIFDTEVPVAAPGNEEELQEIVRFAASERLALVPIGLGTKLGWRARPEKLDLAVSTRRLAGIVAHEPGDGVITALAGTRWSDLEDKARAGGHHVAPAVASADRATLGGTIGAGASGFDRLRYGPLRHQVLGVRAILSDGSTTKSGGRLVKNVTGYDLHRLYTGARGTLSIVVEAALRLHPLPVARAIVSAAFASRTLALAAARALLAPPLAPRCVVAHDLCPSKDGGGWTLHAVLAGRAEAVAADAEIARARIPSAFVYRGEAHHSPVDMMEREIRELGHSGDAWPTFEIGCLPTQLQSALERLEMLERERGIACRTLAHPGIASASVWTGELDADSARAIDALAHELGLELAWRALDDDVRAALAPRPRAGARSLEALKRAFDPQGVFAGGP